jgi:predicted secreted protein
MGAVLAVEMPAVEARERLADFVAEVVRGFRTSGSVRTRCCMCAG